ncbi:MAG TPA: hypothetical protein VGI92_13660 [Gemmatimonadales bacterium]
MMTSRPALVLTFFFSGLFLAAPLRAQAPARLLDAARTRLEDIQPDSAAALATQALDRRNGPTSADQLRGWTLLGIAEVMRGRPFVARQAFRHALERDNALRIDSLAYLHSDVREVFETERVTFQTAAAEEPAQTVTVRGPMDVSVIPSQGRYGFEVRSTRPTRVTASITSARGDEVWSDTESANPAANFSWDLTTNGAPIAPGRYALRVTAPDGPGKPPATTVRNFQVSRVRVDTVAVPQVPDDSLLPEAVQVRRPSTLLAGVALGAGAIVLTSVAGNKAFSGNGDSGRFIVAAAVSTAAIVGFFNSRHSRPIPENINYNNNLRDRYEQLGADMTTENRRRQASAPLRIRMETTRMDASR